MTAAAPAPRIGVLINEVEGGFQTPLIEGLRNKAREHGLRLLLFPGHGFHSPDVFERQFNMMYHLVDPTRLDGIVSVTSSLQLPLSSDDLIQFLARLQSVPLVSLGLAMPGVPAIQIDNRNGFQALLDHFVHVHGYRRIAFMCGPPDNYDAQLRFTIYRETLAAAGLPYDDQLVVTGHFDPYIGRVAMEELLARNVRFDALIAANDEMALAAISVAVERGYHVPDDFAVGGFDDLLSLRREGLSLTTVSQAVLQQAEAALECLLARMRGEAVPLLSTVATRLVVRQSCGCIGEQQAAQPLQIDSAPIAAEERRRRVIASLRLPAKQTDEYAEHLLQLEGALFADDAEERFDGCLSDIASACLDRYGDL